MACMRSLRMLQVGLLNTSLLPDHLFKTSSYLIKKCSYTLLLDRTNEGELIDDKPKKTKKPSKAKTAKSPANAIIRALEKDANFLEIKHLIPEKILKQKRKLPEELYLIDKDAAYDMLFSILPYLQTPSAAESKLLEINPGLGFFTDLLLSNWNREITLYEHNKHFCTSLNGLLENYGNRVNVKYEHFYDIWRLAYQDKYDNGNRTSKMLDNMQPIPWGKEFCSTIIGSCPSPSFLKHVIHSLIFQYSIMKLGRHQMFFIMTPIEYIHLTCNREAGYRHYRASTILFQILFEFKLLRKLPRKSFLPWVTPPKQPRTFSAKLQIIDSDFLYLIRVVPRENLFDLCKTDDLKKLWYFIKHNCLSRKNRVIPYLERWIPNCGPRLITSPTVERPPSDIKTMDVEGFKINLESPPLHENDYYQNMTIFTEFGDLNPSQLLTLFYQFSNFAEFSESTFVASMENLLVKIEDAENIIDDIDNDDDDSAMTDEDLEEGKTMDEK